MTDVAGDEELGAALSRRLGRPHRVAGVAVVTAAGARTAVVGAPLEADFEIGSISKGLTGLLYVDALGRGEVRPDSSLGELLPLGECPAASVTLESLSIHRSGLPSLPRSARPLRRSLSLLLRGANPYGDTLEQLLAQTRGVRLRRPGPKYSNLGFQLLGHAVAAGAGAGFADLLQSRLAGPLGLTGMYVPADASALRPTALMGVGRGGRLREPWTGEALGPAGGVRASIGDLATLLGSLLSGSAPGMAALEPVAPFGMGARIGAAWVTLEHKGRSIVWHNGGTGGFRAWAGLDRGAGVAVAVLTATSASMNRHGFALLAEHGG